MSRFEEFAELVAAPRNFFACYNPFLCEQIWYQSGIRIPVIPAMGLNTNVTSARLPDLSRSSTHRSSTVF